MAFQTLLTILAIPPLTMNGAQGTNSTSDESLPFWFSHHLLQIRQQTNIWLNSRNSDY